MPEETKTPAAIADNAAALAHGFKTRAPRSRAVAVVLAIFLGNFGMHKFYLGKKGWGLIYLLFCWTLIPAMMGIIEGLHYMSISKEDFRQRYTP